MSEKATQTHPPKHKTRPVSLTSPSDRRHKNDVRTDITQEWCSDESADSAPSGRRRNDRDAMSEPCSSGNRLMVVACVVSVVCLCMLSVGSLAMYFSLKDKVLMSRNENNGHQVVCVPCDQVMPSPALGMSDTTSIVLDTLEVRRPKDEGKEECCAHTLAQYAAVFKLILAKQEEAVRLAEVPKTADANEPQSGHVSHHGKSSSKVVSAHLALKPLVRGVTNSDILQWKSPAESSQSHIRPGLKLGNNSETLSVHTPGLYFLYCQTLHLTARANSSKRVISMNVIHKNLSNGTTSGILLTSRITLHDLETTYRHTNYEGGLFKLSKEGQLFVMVSGPGTISHDESDSFFGLFRVGD